MNNIDEYLKQMKKALAGCDRAVIQDALADAEEYLRNELEAAREKSPDKPEAELLSPIIEKYGPPDEIASEYRNIEVRIRPALTRPVKKSSSNPVTRFFGVLTEPAAWGALFYLLFFSLISGIFYFTWVVTGLSLSAGLMILIVGLPLAALFLLSVRGISLVEGRIVEALLGVRMPRRQTYAVKSDSLWGWFKSTVSDRYTWYSLLYMVLALPLGITYFTVFVTLIAVAAWGIAIPILEIGYDIHVAYINNMIYYVPGWLMPLTVIGGALLAVATMHLAKAVGAMHGQIAKAMLVRI